MPISYGSEHCDHRLVEWVPPAEGASNLARNYRMREHTIGSAYFLYSDRLPGRTDYAAETRRRFDTYAEEWTAQTSHLSVLGRRLMHPSYQKIIGLGRDALPLILSRLLSRPDHWFWALRSISGEDPVRPEDVGTFDAMRDAWIRWGRKRGLVR